MAAAARQATGPSLVPLVLIGTLIAAGAGVWFGYPGLILIIVGVAVSAFIAPPAILTGKKDASGFPTAISPAEQTAMNRYRMWGELKWRALVPSMDWLPGWPLRMWWLVSVPLAAAALALPSPELGEWWRFANALGVFITINVLNGSLRRWTAPDDLCDGPTIGVAVAAVRSEPKTIAAFVAGAIVAIVVFVGVLVLVDKLGLGFFIDPMQPWQLGLALGLATFLSIATVSVRTAALEKWRTMVRVRAEWSPRWQIAKLDPAPHLIDHVEHGPMQVDTFETHASVGAGAIYPLVGKITASIGSGARIAILESPNVDSQNQPVQGSKHPLRFRIVTFISDDMPDLNNPAIDQAEAELLIASAASWVSDSLGTGRWVFLDASPMHDAEPDEDGNFGTGAWVAHFAQPDGPDYSWMRNSGLGELGGSIGAEALVDHRAGEAFLGALTEGTTRFQEPGMEKHLQDLALTDVWGARWGNILKMGAVQPRPEHGVFVEATLGHAVLYRQPFVVQQGMDPLDFFKLESKISTTLSAAPFVAVTGFSGSGDRPGERHPQAFCVTWSSTPVASNPDKLVPTDGPAPRWVLSGRINSAFDAARLARPEVSDVRPLTDRKSRGHLWEIKLRLHGGVTLSEVRTAAQKIRQHLGSDWLRVAEAQDGCVIVAGADPKDTRRVVFARPEQKNRDYVTSLDWEQAFSDTKLQNSAGVLPKLTETSTLPSNDQVQVLDFKLPTGTDRSMVKASISKLQTATGNAFVEVRPSPQGADHVRILVSREHPLPSSASVNWEVVDASNGPLYFGTGVEGEPVGFDPKSDPHLLVVGASGGGKASRLTDLIPVPTSARFPLGWARNGELEVGDSVYAADGSITKVVGFSEVSIEPVYDVHFTDGQVVGVGANHLWKASTAASRAVHTPGYEAPREAKHAAYAARAAALRVIAKGYAAGVSARLDEIAGIAGYSSLALYGIDELKFLGTSVLLPTARSTSQFRGAEIVAFWDKTLRRRGSFMFCGTSITQQHVDASGIGDGWYSTRELAEALLGGSSTRAQRDAAKQIVKRSKAPRRAGTGMSRVTVYPVDEVLTILADRFDYQSTRGSGGEAQALESVVDTKTMFSSVRHETPARSALNYGVRTAGPIAGAVEDLIIDPYILGAWLGDGSSRLGQITSAAVASCTDSSGLTDQAHMMGQVRAHYPRAHVIQSSTTCISVPGLSNGLKAAGLTRNKHIPALYLRSSKEQRLALLQGLMDTDGTIGATGASEIDLCDQRLADDVLELIRSLGIRVAQRAVPAQITEDDPENPGQKRQRETSTRYRLKFTTDIPVFRLPRKLERIPAQLRGTQQWNYVEEITAGAPEPLRCIMVAHPEHLYLTHQFIPTHNSVSLQVVIYPALVSGAELYVIDPTKGGADFQFAAPYAKAFAATDIEAVAVMKAVYAEVIRRKNLNAANGVGGYRELPEEIRPKHIYVVMDEFTSLMQTEAVQKTPFDDPEAEAEREETIAGNQRRQYIGTMTGKIAREARSAGVTLILATQKLSAVVLDSIPGANDLKTNLARMLMGNATFGEKMSALKNPMEAPDMGDIIPKGRGLWESTEGNARLMQVWFEPSQTTFAAKLAERREPLTPDEKLDLSPFIRSTEKVERTLPSDRQNETPVEPEIVTVGEFEFTLDDLDVDEAPDEPLETMGGDETPAAVPVLEVPVEPALEAPEYMPEPVRPSGTTVVIAATDADVEAYRERGALVLLPEAQTSESDIHGWWKIDAALSALGAHQDVTSVVWVDAELDDEDEIGIPYVELAREVFDAEGIALEAVVPAREVAAAPSPAATSPRGSASSPKTPLEKKQKAADIESPDFAEPQAPRATTTIYDDLF